MTGIGKNRRMKASVEMLEYMFLTLFVVVIIIGFVLFLSWWNISQMGVEKTNVEMESVLLLAKSLSSSPFIAREDGVLDDGKLTVLQDMDVEACTRLGEIYGNNWFAVVHLYDGRADTPCTTDNYPDCNYWTLCEQPSKQHISYSLPVNVYRNIGMVLTTGIIGVNYVGSMEVGLYI